MAFLSDFYTALDLYQKVKKGWASAGEARAARKELGNVTLDYHERISAASENKLMKFRIEEFKKLFEGNEEALNELLTKDAPDDIADESGASPVAAITQSLSLTPIAGQEWFCGAIDTTSWQEPSPSIAQNSPKPNANIPEVKAEDRVVLRFLKAESELHNTLTKCEEIFTKFDEAYPDPNTAADLPALTPLSGSKEDDPIPTKTQPNDVSSDESTVPIETSDESESEVSDCEEGAAKSDESTLPPPPPPPAAAVSEPNAESASVSVSVPPPAILGNTRDVIYYFWNGCLHPYHGDFQQIRDYLSKAEEKWSLCKEDLMARCIQEDSEALSNQSIEDALRKHEELKQLNHAMEAKVDRLLHIIQLSDNEQRLLRISMSGDKLFLAVRSSGAQKDYSQLASLCEAFHGEVKVLDWTHPALSLNSLGYAATFGYAQAVKLLLEAGATVECAGLGVGKPTPLFHAVQHHGDNYTETVELLLDKGADVNFVMSEGKKQSPLHWAAKYAHPSHTALLISRGANVNISDSFGSTPLSLALRTILENKVSVSVIEGLMKVVDVLLDNQAEVLPEYLFEIGSNLNHRFSSHTLSASLLEKIITHPNCASLNLMNAYMESKGSLLYYYVDVNFVAGVKILIDSGATVSHLAGRKKSAPIFLAIAKRSKTSTTGHSSNCQYMELIAELLRASDLNLSATDYAGRTPVFLAVTTSQVHAVKALLAKCASSGDDEASNKLSAVIVNERTKTGQTCLLEAIQLNSSEIVGMILAAGADPNIPDKSGCTPALLATKLLRFDCLKLLVAAGCDLQASSADSPSPIEYIHNKMNADYDLEGVEIDTEIEAADEEIDEDQRALQVYQLVNLKCPPREDDQVIAVSSNGCAGSRNCHVM